MIDLLDTNAVIALMKNNVNFVKQARRAGREQPRICAPVEAKLWYGVYKSGKPEENRNHLLTLLAWLPSLPFSSKAAHHFGEIRASWLAKANPWSLRLASRRHRPRSWLGWALTAPANLPAYPVDGGRLAG
ncbi:MAG: type II toxin-antitoxin system VapC family toxin [Candidatus Competibacter sp.]|nr:type II toxin-antitoxin system VapC family toxin [Candidatus Competibacter sp.]MDG4584791.1 type II toxin-antitoxin system VapC family toxin [Candidatus Competibacter sp.]